MRDKDSERSNAVNQTFGNILVSLATCARAAGEMAGQSDIGVSSDVYSWLSSTSNGLNLQRLAPEFERRGLRSKHSLKYNIDLAKPKSGTPIIIYLLLFILFIIILFIYLLLLLLLLSL